MAESTRRTRSLKVGQEKSKKFVFHIYPENVEYIEDLTYQEKNDFLNQLITYHMHEEQNELTKKKAINYVKNIGIFLAVLFIAMPLIIFLINASLDVTKSNYSDMQTKFENLYRSKGRIK